jgi:hypothetical protein
MSVSVRMLKALSAICFAVALFASSTFAAGPATVTVRVEGLTETKLPPTEVTTSAAPVVKDGNPEHACSGTSAVGALQLATGGNWDGPWNGEFKQYEIFSIEGESHVFESGAPANYFWSFWLNDKEAEVGACEAELQPGDHVLFFPSCFGEACPPSPLPLGIEVPATANAGEQVSVTISEYKSNGESSAAADVTLAGGGASATTDSAGHATLTFASPGTFMLQASAPGTVRTEEAICVHRGNDGTCGTQAPSSSSSSAGGTSVGTPYKGQYALVPQLTSLLDGHTYTRGHAPRVLSGNVLAHTTVSSISLTLRREYRGRCYAFDGVSTRFVRARCGTGSPFKVSSNGVFSYLLPSALAPGRYVLDVEATDAAGNRTALARGTSRIVFYVR